MPPARARNQGGEADAMSASGDIRARTGGNAPFLIPTATPQPVPGVSFGLARRSRSSALTTMPNPSTAATMKKTSAIAG